MLLLSLACYVNTVYLGPPAGNTVHEEEAIFFLWGATPEHHVDLDAVCPEGVSSIHEEQDFGDSALSCCTVGFIQRVTIRVTCADGSAWKITDEPHMGGSLAVKES